MTSRSRCTAGVLVPPVRHARWSPEQPIRMTSPATSSDLLARAANTYDVPESPYGGRPPGRRTAVTRCGENRPRTHRDRGAVLLPGSHHVRGGRVGAAARRCGGMSPPAHPTSTRCWNGTHGDMTSASSSVLDRGDQRAPCRNGAGTGLPTDFLPGPSHGGGPDGRRS